MSDITQILDSVAQNAERFIGLYYRTLDTRRNNIASMFEPSAPIVYNGNPVVGGAAYAELYSQMPMTAHEVTGFDCHPLTALGANGMPSIALTTSGKVRIGNDVKKNLCGFSESLILRPQGNGRYLVSTAGYRILYVHPEYNIEP
ncbi:uncharacterized protein V1518DRAFT_411196 [Limtongia smithiae]|uniref:uncharacterized protein n=1 Tax=Limtongia smithiae TaxID=1125753 RepID=UPI0034D004A5